MTLRVRLLITALAVAVPIMAAGSLGYRHYVTRLKDELVTALVRDRALEACDQGRTRFPLNVPGRGPFSSETRLEVSLTRVPGEGEGGATRLVPLDDPRCPWAVVKGPVLGQRPILPPPMIVLPVLIAVLTVTIGLWPVVRRARRMTDSIERWRADHSALPLADGEADELGELSRALADAAQTIAGNEKSLREFVESVGHDLATPLTVLQGHLSELSKSDDSELVRRAMNETHYLGALLQSLAVTAKFEAGVRVDGTFDLAAVIERVALRHQPLAERKRVSFAHTTPGSPVIAQGDETFAEQALTNLVSNAVRALNADGHLALVLDATADRFVISVSDDGPGLSDEERARVLQRGVRGEQARQREPSGRGLGLSIVSRVATLHGWTFLLAPNQPTGLIATLEGARVQTTSTASSE